MGVSDIARRADVPTSTAFRLLAYLVESGFVAKDGTLYRPGDKLFELGNQVALCRPLGLREQAAPYLGELYAATGMTVRMAVLDGTEIVIVNKIVGLRTPAERPPPSAAERRPCARRWGRRCWHSSRPNGSPSCCAGRSPAGPGTPWSTRAFCSVD